MDADMLADDEFHAPADPVVRPHRRLEGKIGVAEIDHDLRAGPADARSTFEISMGMAPA